MKLISAYETGKVLKLKVPFNWDISMYSVLKKASEKKKGGKKGKKGNIKLYFFYHVCQMQVLPILKKFHVKLSKTSPLQKFLNW
jgi:hypothetical protein